MDLLKKIAEQFLHI